MNELLRGRHTFGIRLTGKERVNKRMQYSCNRSSSCKAITLISESFIFLHFFFCFHFILLFF